MDNSSEQTLYYIHDTTRGYVGNSMVWWKQGHYGYTCDLRHAHKFTYDEAFQIVHNSEDLVAYAVDEIDSRTEVHVPGPTDAKPTIVAARIMPRYKGLMG